MAEYTEVYITANHAQEMFVQVYTKVFSDVEVMKAIVKMDGGVNKIYGTVYDRLTILILLLKENRTPDEIRRVLKGRSLKVHFQYLCRL